MMGLYHEFGSRKRELEDLTHAMRAHTSRYPLPVDPRVVALGFALLASRRRRAVDAVDVTDAVGNTAWPEDVPSASTVARLASHALWVYGASTATAAPEDVGFSLVVRANLDVARPVFSILRDEQLKAIVVAVRGTDTLGDVLTDLYCAPAHLGDHQCHLGMLAAARSVLTSSWAAIDGLLIPHQWPLIFVGHSLGGGVAALAAALYKEATPQREVRAVCFGPPACVSESLVAETRSFISSFVNASDCVPRLHYQSLHSLAQDLAAIDWNAELAALVDSATADGPRLVQEARAIVAAASKSGTLPRALSSEELAKLAVAAPEQPPQLYPPGRTFHLVGARGVVERPPDYWARLVLSPSLVDDHAMRAYHQAIVQRQ